MDLQLPPCSSQQNEEDTEVNTQDTLSQEDVDNSLEFEVEDSAVGPGLAPLPSGRASTISTASVGSLPAGTSAERITSSSSKSRPGKRKADDELLTLVRDRLQVPDEDEHDAFAKTVAFKMKKLNNRQCFIAEKLINDVLYEAGLEQLSTQSCVVPQLSVVQYADDSNQEVYRTYQYHKL